MRVKGEDIRHSYTIFTATEPWDDPAPDLAS